METPRTAEQRWGIEEPIVFGIVRWRGRARLRRTRVRRGVARETTGDAVSPGCREARQHGSSRRVSPVAHEVSTACSGRRQGSVSRVPAKWTSTPSADLPIHLACGRCGSTSSGKEDQEELAPGRRGNPLKGLFPVEVLELVSWPPIRAFGESLVGFLRGCGVWSMVRVPLLLLYVSGVFELARTLLMELDARPPFFCGGRGRLAMSRGCALQLLSHPLLTAAQLRQIHAHLLTFSTHLASARRIFDETCSWTSLLTAYARAGQLNEARSLFDGMPHRTPVAWSAVLSAYVGAGSFADALEVFDRMLRARVRPNRAAVVGALAACGALRALEQGWWVHALVAAPDRSGMDGVVATTLVDMYAKWGILEAATQVFAAMLERERDAFAYTAMISGLSDHGRCREAVELFGQMQD
ncbi:hypothetical protein ACQ4PT_016664 [Festuca glaucescens]